MADFLITHDIPVAQLRPIRLAHKYTLECWVPKYTYTHHTPSHITQIHVLAWTYIYSEVFKCFPESHLMYKEAAKKRCREREKWAIYLTSKDLVTKGSYDSYNNEP